MKTLLLKGDVLEHLHTLHYQVVFQDQVLLSQVLLVPVAIEQKDDEIDERYGWSVLPISTERPYTYWDF